MTRILYVEDEADLRTTVVEVLEEEGFETASACNGAEGLAAADVFRP
jgi:CheY-like chemotaxis protein